MREPREEEDEEKEREGGVEWRRLGRKGWSKAGRWAGRIEDNNMVRSLWRDLEDGEGRRSRGQPKSLSCAGRGPSPLPLLVQLPHPEEEQHSARVAGDISATNTAVGGGQKAWCLGLEEMLLKNISDYLCIGGSQQAAVIYIAGAGR